MVAVYFFERIYLALFDFTKKQQLMMRTIVS